MGKTINLIIAIIGIVFGLTLIGILFFMFLTTEPFTLLGYTVVEWDLIETLMFSLIGFSFGVLLIGVSSGVLIGNYLWKDGNETKLTSKVTTQVSSSNFCSNCGKQLTEKKLDYCRYCGIKLKEKNG